MWKDAKYRYPTFPNLAEMQNVLKQRTQYIQRNSQNAESKKPKDSETLMIRRIGGVQSHFI